MIVEAAGNDGKQKPVYPAPSCLAVAATTRDDTLAPLSNHGDWVDVAAPGFQIFSTLPVYKYGIESGTSFAAAYVTGLVALMYGRVVDININGFINDEVRNLVETGCHLINVNGTGAGLIDMTASWQQMLAMKP